MARTLIEFADSVYMVAVGPGQQLIDVPPRKFQLDKKISNPSNLVKYMINALYIELL